MSEWRERGRGCLEDRERRAPDVAEVERLVGCINPTTLDDTILSVIEYFRERPAIR